MFQGVQVKEGLDNLYYICFRFTSISVLVSRQAWNCFVQKKEIFSVTTQ